MERKEKKNNYYKTALVLLGRIPDGRCAEPFIKEVIEALSAKLAYKKMHLVSMLLIAGLLTHPLVRDDFERMYREFLSTRSRDEVIKTTSYIDQVKAVLRAGSERESGNV